MKILYDYQIFQMQNYGGVSKYFYNLFKEFDTDERIRYDVGLDYTSNYYVSDGYKPKIERLVNSKNRILRGSVNKLYELLNQRKSKSLISNNDFDIFHPTYYDTYFTTNLKKPFVATIYDMNQEKLPEIFGKNSLVSNQKRLQCEYAKKIFAISENTKQDLIEIFNISEKKIIVSHLSGQLDFKDIDTNLAKKLPLKYVLFVGERKSYKNFSLFLEAINPLIKNDESLNIVCTGPKFSQLELDFFKEEKILDKIHHYSPNEKEMFTLYNKALCFVYPSLYEGFGIPTLEAMGASCPVLISNTSSFPEVGGQAAQYFDPYDMLSIRSTIENVIYNSDIRDQMIQKGIKQQENFSWNKTAAITKSVYENII